MLHTEILAQLCQQIGSNPDYVQGAGGNISLKINSHEMIIKSSGIRLSQVSKTHGYVKINYLDYKSISDKQSFSLKNKEQMPRPSIETALHALLDTTVIHTHALMSNLLTCSLEGKSICLKLFPEAKWIDYVPPGYDLFISLKQSIENAPCTLFFLQNHGVIVSINDPEKALASHEILNQKIKDYFFKDKMPSFNKDYLDTKNILFPDQVIYSFDEKQRLSTFGRENIEACGKIISLIESAGLTPHYLGQSEARFLLEMEEEKYRQELGKTK